jgi:hypothetical protein
MMLPIALSVLRLFQQDTNHAFAPALLLAVAYRANLGGMSTLVGTAPNAILAGFLQETQGIQLGFLRWMILALPVSLLLSVVTWLVLTRLAFRVPTLSLPGGQFLSGPQPDDNLGPAQALTKQSRQILGRSLNTPSSRRLKSNGEFEGVVREVPAAACAASMSPSTTARSSACSMPPCV